MIIIVNVTIITLNEANQVLRNGAIVIQNDRIIDLGDSTAMQTKYEAEVVIDATGKLVLPGLINSHTHMCRSLLRGKTADIPLEKFLKHVYDYRASVSKEELRIATLLSYIEMIKSGTTCFVSHQNARFIEEAIEATIPIGLRGVFARILIDDPRMPDNLRESPPEAVKNTLNLCEKHSSESRIRVIFGPMGLHNCSLELMKEAGKANQEHKLGIHTHCSETKETAEKSRRLYKQSEMQALQKAGILASDTTLVHCSYISDYDIEIIGNTNSSIVHCPGSINRKRNGSILASRLAQGGIKVAIGSDGPSNCHNLFKELREYALLDESLSPFNLLRMATINGAKALRMEEEIGSLELGKKADMIIIDQPSGKNPLFDLAISSGDVLVTDVIVDGQFIMRNRKILTCDEGQIMQNVLPYIETSFWDRGSS